MVEVAKPSKSARSEMLLSSTEDFAFPLFCFTHDSDIWQVSDRFELTTCGPETLETGIQLGMEMVDVDGKTWKVTAVEHVGYAPFRWSKLFAPRMKRVDHVLEAGAPWTLAMTQDRVCASMDAFPEYFCEPSEFETVLVERKAEVRAARSIADIHHLIGPDYFSY